MEQKLIKINLNNISDIKRFIKISQTFCSDIDIVKGKVVVDGKSLLGIMALDLTEDIYVRIITDNVAEKRKFDAEMEEFR